MSKFLVGLALAASAIVTPALSFAQTNSPSRGDIAATEAKINAQNDHKLAIAAVGGTAANGGTSAGARVHKPMSSTCVGPISFCEIYFGS